MVVLCTSKEKEDPSMTINVANRNPVARIDDKSDDFGKLAAWITENLGGPVDKIVRQRRWRPVWRATYQDNGAPTDLLCKGTREWSAHRSEEHTSELQSLMRSSYAVFCLKNK